MLMRSERDGAIDAAIAAAAEALTSAAPSAALRVGVRDRIGRRHTAWWLVPAAAAAVVLVAILGRTLSGPAVPDGPDRVRAADVRLAIEHASPQLETVGRALSGPPDRVRPAVTPPVRRLAAAFEPPVEEMEPLIPPITIPPLETELIVVDASSGVMPIEIEPLRIEPLQGE